MTRRFKELSDFILNQMRMSHIYQPVMLIELLQRQGSASTTEIAKAISAYDNSQVEYYEDRVINMVGKVLTDNRGITSKTGNQYSLKGFADLSESERNQLIGFCKGRLEEFLLGRGDQIWEHRVRNIDRDETNLRGIDAIYKAREKGCIFCEMPKDRIIGENELAYAVLDSFPVTKQHTLVIPKRHVPDYFSLYQLERDAINQLLEAQRERILDLDSTVTGFNIGNNVGEDAGQTVMHCHTHLIARRQGDVGDPRGGIRGVIPDKQKY